jgi:recombinational DNA repair protein RecT
MFVNFKPSFVIFVVWTEAKTTLAKKKTKKGDDFSRGGNWKVLWF